MPKHSQFYSQIFIKSSNTQEQSEKMFSFRPDLTIDTKGSCQRSIVSYDFIDHRRFCLRNEEKAEVNSDHKWLHNSWFQECYDNGSDSILLIGDIGRQDRWFFSRKHFYIATPKDMLMVYWKLTLSQVAQSKRIVEK